MGRFLIWSIEHGAWWRPDEIGYTKELDEAGLYPLQRAREIVERANVVKFHECMIPAECTWLPPAPKSDEDIVMQLRERAALLLLLMPDETEREARSRIATMFVRAAMQNIVQHIGPGRPDAVAWMVGEEIKRAVAERLDEIEQAKRDKSGPPPAIPPAESQEG